MEKFDLRNTFEVDKHAIQRQVISIHTSGKKNIEIIECLGENRDSITNWLKAHNK